MNHQSSYLQICILPLVLILYPLVKFLNTSPGWVSNEKSKIDDHKSWSSTNTGSAIQKDLLSLNNIQLIELESCSKEIIAVFCFEVVRYWIVDNGVDASISVPAAHLSPVDSSLSHVLLGHDVKDSIASCLIHPIHILFRQAVASKSNTSFTNRFDVELTKEISIGFVTESVHNEHSISVVPETAFSQTQRSSVLVGVKNGQFSIWLPFALFLTSDSVVSIIVVVELVVF